MIEWFVIYNNEHLGPFSESVLYQLHEEGDVKDDTLVWREGMKDPVTFKEQFVLSTEQLHFKPLVDMVSSNKSQEENKGQVEMLELRSHADQLDDDVPPPLPPIVLAQVTSTNQNLEASVEQADLVEQTGPIEIEVTEAQLTEELSDDEVKSRSGRVYLIFVSLLSFLVILPATFYLKKSLSSFTRPAQMSINDYDRLKEISQDPSVKNKFAFAISQDRTKLWIASNNPYEGEIVLKVKSVKGKTLTNSEIEAFSKSKLEGKLAEFQEWTFSKGGKFVDGYYQIEVFTMTDLRVPLIFSIVSKRKKEFRFFDEVLISQLSQSEFERELNKNKQKLADNDLAFWEELKQKYQTVKMITTQIRDEINRAFESQNTNWREELKKFELKYKREFGSFFTNFVIQNDRSYEELNKKEFSNKLEIISNYNRLSRLARDIGRVTMDIFHEMETFDGIDDARKEVIHKKAVDGLNFIIQTCDEKIAIIQTL